MTSKTEAVLRALEARLQTIAISTRRVLRDEGVPQEVPADGLVILHDGDPGEPEELLGGQGPYLYAHDAEIGVIVQSAKPAVRAAKFDALKVAVAGALDADPTLGGAVDALIYAAPAASEEGIEGMAGAKKGTIPVTLEYQSESRI